MTQQRGNRIFLMEEQLKCRGVGAAGKGHEGGVPKGPPGRAMSISEHPALDGLSAGATTLLNPVAQEEGSGATNSTRSSPVPLKAALAVGRTNPMPALGRRLPIPADKWPHGSGSSGEASV